MSKPVGYVDCLTVTELAITEPKGRVVRSMTLVEAAWAAAARGWVTVAYPGGECLVTATAAGKAALEAVHGPYWLFEWAEMVQAQGWTTQSATR